MLRLDRVVKPWMESGALNAHINLYGFWNDEVFITKSGDLGIVLQVRGVDYESLDQAAQEYAVKRLEAALKIFGPGFHACQYLLKTNRPQIPFQSYDDPIVQAAVNQRKDFFDSKLESLFEVEIFYAIVIEGTRSKTGVTAALKQLATDPMAGLRELKAQFSNDKMKILLREHIEADLLKLEQRVNSFIRQLADFLPIDALQRDDCFRFFCRLVNYDLWRIEGKPITGQFLDCQVVNSDIEAERDYLRVGNHFVRVLTMKEAIGETKPLVLKQLLEIQANFCIATEWAPLETAMTAILRDEPTALNDTGWQGPPELQRILVRCLEKNVARRFQSASDLAFAIESLSGTSTATKVLPPKSRRAWLPWVIAAALLMGTVVWEMVRPSAPTNRLEKAHFTRLTDFESVDAAISPDGRFVAFVSDHDGPFDVWLTQVGSGRLINLTQGKAGPLPAPLRNVGFSGDGSEIWIGGGDVGLRLRMLPLTGGTPRNFLGEKTVNLAWSPDGQRIVYHTFGSGDPMFVTDRSGANARQIFVDRPGLHNHFPAWSPDGRWIYFVHGTPDTRDRDLFRIDPAGGNPERLTYRNTDIAYPTPVGNRTVFYVARDSDGSGPWLWALDLKSRESRRMSIGLEQYTSVQASADGLKLVADISNPAAGLWTVPILDRVAGEADVKPFAVQNVRALAPRFGGSSLFYLWMEA